MVFKTFYTRGKAADDLKSTMQSLIATQVKDKEVAMRLTPNYDIGCKRPTISDIYLPTFNNPCVELNTTGIKRITSEGIVTADERELQFDAIVFATGFDVTRSINAFEQVGTENKDFAEEDTPRAFLGITKPNQPNFFMLFGPGTINTSVIFMIECQAEYIINGITKMLKIDAKAISLRPSVLDKFEEYLREKNATTAFGHGDCTSYYKNSAGENWVVWTRLMWQYWWRTRKFELEDYDLVF